MSKLVHTFICVCVPVFSIQVIITLRCPVNSFMTMFFKMVINGECAFVIYLCIYCKSWALGRISDSSIWNGIISIGILLDY